MSEECGVCGRPKGDSHRYPVAGECTAPDSADYTVSLQCLSIALRKAQDDMKAAEERGRRRGVEERNELRALLREEMERQHYVAAPGPESEDVDLCGGCGNAWPCEDADCFVFKARALLAPRDSASQHKDWCALFGNPEAGKSCDCREAPRDSGKEG